jgi:hypothetical protein
MRVWAKNLLGEAKPSGRAVVFFVGWRVGKPQAALVSDSACDDGELKRLVGALKLLRRHQLAARER